MFVVVKRWPILVLLVAAFGSLFTTPPRASRSISTGVALTAISQAREKRSFRPHCYRILAPALASLAVMAFNGASRRPQPSPAEPRR